MTFDLRDLEAFNALPLTIPRNPQNPSLSVPYLRTVDLPTF